MPVMNLQIKKYFYYIKMWSCASLPFSFNFFNLAARTKENILNIFRLKITIYIYVLALPTMQLDSS